MAKRITLFNASSPRQDVALLVLRLFTALPLFLKHGTEKLFHFQAMAAHFPNPLHIGAVPSLLFATLSDGICSLLVIFGLGTRWAALIIFINIGVAWAFVGHFAFFGRRGEGELMVLYLAAMFAIFLAGPGRYSIDGRLRK
ncbi:MAG: DoxX family protein [Terracidiphilus sp.]